MKAIVLHGHGGPEALRFEQVPTPTPGPGDVLVRVHAVSVNRSLDLMVRAGTYDAQVSFPLVLGVDPSGLVEATGPGVERPKVGDRIAVISPIRCGQCEFCRAGNEETCRTNLHVGVHRWGGYAEYVCVPASNVIPIPDELSFAEATVITRHFPTAFHLLLSMAKLEPGDWVLIMGAAGALGTAAVQVARLVGARIIAAAGSDARVEASRANGADYGVNYRGQDLAGEVMRITGGRGVDVVCENIADPTLWPGAFNSLAFRGRLVTAGAHGGGQVTLDVRRLYHRRLQIIGGPGSTRRDLDRALEEVRAGRIRAVVDRIMPLREAAVAHRLLEDNSNIGKIILDPTAS